MPQGECGRRDDGDGRAGIALAGENVEDDVGGVDAVGERFGAGCFDRRQPVGEHRDQDVDHLPIAVIGPGLRRTRSMAAGSTQSLKGAPLRRAPGLRASTGT